jgi:hypothetical protein
LTPTLLMVAPAERHPAAQLAATLVLVALEDRGRCRPSTMACMLI